MHLFSQGNVTYRFRFKQNKKNTRFLVLVSNSVSIKTNLAQWVKKFALQDEDISINIQYLPKSQGMVVHA